MVAGAYKRSLRGDNTFIPQPLLPRLDFPASLERNIEHATHLLGKVEMCRTLLPNADLLIYSSLQREAIASSTIEGTIASADELIRYQVSEYSERGAVREVGNYTVALEWGCQQLATRPISENLILGLHERLLAGVRGAGHAGRFKEHQNWIGSRPTDPIRAAVFVPPPPEDVQQLIRALERYINSENHEPRIVQCAITHYQFETIHPFNDGNGRVGRLLIVLQMIQLGLLSAPLIYPSVYFERTRSEYYERLQAVRDHSAWIEWIAFFTQGIVQQSEETLAFTQKILHLREQLRQQVSSARRRAALHEVLDAFFHQPVRSVRQICDVANMAHTSVQPALDDLRDMGVVYEITGKQRGRVYACRPVLDAIFGSME
jgi:Fic family protein